MSYLLYVVSALAVAGWVFFLAVARKWSRLIDDYEVLADSWAKIIRNRDRGGYHDVEQYYSQNEEEVKTE